MAAEPGQGFVIPVRHRLDKPTYRSEEEMRRLKRSLRGTLKHKLKQLAPRAASPRYCQLDVSSEEVVVTLRYTGKLEDNDVDEITAVCRAAMIECTGSNSHDAAIN